MLEIYKNQALVDLKFRFKRSLPETFEEATEKGDYNYWLSQEDIADISRIEYNNYKFSDSDNSEFEILGSMQQFERQLEQFQKKVSDNQLEQPRITFIINLSNLHWVTLVITYKNQAYKAYYIDSLNFAYDFSFLERYNIELNSPLHFIRQQAGASNCGLWALENAYDLNKMIHENWAVNWGISQLNRPRNMHYFEEKRQLLAGKFRTDLTRKNRFLQSAKDAPIKTVSESDLSEPNAKRIKLTTEELPGLVETFVEAFISECVKKIAAARIIAKDQGLTESAFINEIKTTAMAALFGAAIAQSPAGTIPSMVAFIRSTSPMFYLPKSKAQKTTNAFSNAPSNGFSPILAEAALEIFQSFEAQFAHVTDKAGKQIAMEKLAADAVARLINYITKNWHGEAITSEFITKGVIFGKSETYFSPNIKKSRLTRTAHSILGNDGNNINTADLYEKTGLVAQIANQARIFYKKSNKRNSDQYGYRRLLSWEKNENGELKSNLLDYEQETILESATTFQRYSQTYIYRLQEENIPEKAAEIIGKLNSRYPDLPSKVSKKKPIVFNLRKPVSTFTGRGTALAKLHEILTSDTTAIITGLASLSISATSNQTPRSGIQASLSGLGGIGKTQLALRYAELYANDYEQNVIWLTAETQADLENSFRNLAVKLNLDTKDKYGIEKAVELLTEEIYEYFSGGKSLFIFDNVENYRLIEPFLPKQIPGYKPNILITSRYTNWVNIAQVIGLNVFAEGDAIELAKKVLNLEDTEQEEEIKELNRVVQGLPLALQQALAYIQNRKLIEKFNIKDYLELFKNKSKALSLLNFDFSQYSNDPYTKTVYTTWEITLEKISQELYGDVAIEILYIMAYLCPDSIASQLFAKHYFIESLTSAFSLLKNYALINEARQSTYFTIHRLVQKVAVIKLEKKGSLDKILYLLYRLLKNNKKDAEIRKHYIYFLLHTVNIKILKLHSELESEAEFKKIFVKIQSDSIENLSYFLDMVRLEFEKNIYLVFLKQFFIFFIRKGESAFIEAGLDYIDKLQAKRILTLPELKIILTFCEIKRLANDKELKQRQIISLSLIKPFLEKLFSTCAEDRKKRGLGRCQLSLEEKNNIRKTIAYNHVQTLAHIARFTSSGLFTKDALAALLRGDFNHVAANFGLLAASVISEKISNKLLSTGELLRTEEKNLLEKELFLQDKSALTLLFNEDVITAGKRIFLGKTMKIASPFIRKGISALFVADLVKEINEYKKGNSALLPDIIFTGVIVGIDGIEAGIESAEVLGLISEVSVFTGPIGEGITVIAWIGVEGYHVKKQLEEIKKHVHLTTKEEFFEGIRAFFGFKPSEYIEIRASNNQLVEEAIAFLKQHTEIKRYVFPAWNASAGLHMQSEVYLDKKVNITLSETMPDDPSEGKLICLSRQKSSSLFISNRDKTNIYLCKEAIGVEYLVNRTSDATLIALAQGDDKAMVFSESSTYVLVNNGKKHYEADNSLFILQESAVTGLLKGGKGKNGILMSNFNPSASEYVLLDEQGTLCGKNSSSFLAGTYRCDSKEQGLELENINYIYGRKNRQDIVYINESISYVDGYGGKSKEEPDYIYVTAKSSKDLKFVLRNNCIVLFGSDIEINSADYHIPIGGAGATLVQFPFSKPTQHRFFFDYDLQALSAISIESNQMNFMLSQQGIKAAKEIFTVSIKDGYSAQNDTYTTNNTTLPTNSYYILQKEIEIRFLGKRIYAQQHTNTSLVEIIRDCSLAARRLDMAFYVKHTNNKNETELVLIASNKHEILYSDPSVKNHLIGNLGDTSYVIVTQENKTDPFPVPDITIYKKNDHLSEINLEGTDTLDLRLLVKALKKRCPEQAVFPQITERGNDLIINLTIYSDFVERSCKNRSEPWSIATIKLNNTLADNTWYQNVNVLLEDWHPMTIINKEDTIWGFNPVSLVFDSSKDIIVLTDKDIKKETEIVILKNIGNYTFLRHNSTDLIITNVLDSNTTSFDLCTILLSQFYKQTAIPEKILSIPFVFIDQQIMLSEHKVKINNATEFDVWQLYMQIDNNRNSVNKSSFLIEPLSESASALSASLSENDPEQTKHHGRSFFTTMEKVIGSLAIFGGFLWIRRYLGTRQPTANRIAEGAQALPLLQRQAQARKTIEEIPLKRKSASKTRFFEAIAQEAIAPESLRFKQNFIGQTGAEEKNVDHSTLRIDWSPTTYENVSFFKCLAYLSGRHRLVKRMNKIEQAQLFSYQNHNATPFYCIGK